MPEPDIGPVAADQILLTTAQLSCIIQGQDDATSALQAPPVSTFVCVCVCERHETYQD